MIVKLSKFLTMNITPFILGSFFSRIIFSNDNKYIYTNINYKKSKKINDANEINTSINNYFEKIKNISNFKWIKKENLLNYNLNIKKNSTFYFVLENDLNYNIDKMYSFINKTIYSMEWLYSTDLKEEKIQFLSGFMENRGSIDLSRDFITIDYFYKNIFQLKRINIFYTYFQIPINVLNINIRELQKEFIEGKERNTQFRINLSWYMNYIGLYNSYKANIIKENFISTKSEIKNDTFYYYNNIEINIKKSIIDRRLEYYANNILFDKNFDINKSRKELGLILEENCDEIYRNKKIVKYIIENEPAECNGCKNKYKIEDRTFKKPDGKYYLEVHHMISLANDKHNLDVLENLVKLCPTCHRQLKKNACIEHEQKELVKQILKNNITVKNFCENFLYKFNDSLVDEIYRMLK